MTRSQLILKISKNNALSSAQVENVIDEVFENIIVSLSKGDKVTIAGFGRFEMRERKKKTYINPKTKVPCELSPTSIPGFKASGIMKSRVSIKK